MVELNGLAELLAELDESPHFIFDALNRVRVGVLSARKFLEALHCKGNLRVKLSYFLFSLLIGLSDLLECFLLSLEGVLDDLSFLCDLVEGRMVLQLSFPPWVVHRDSSLQVVKMNVLASLRLSIHLKHLS